MLASDCYYVGISPQKITKTNFRKIQKSTVSYQIYNIIKNYRVYQTTVVKIFGKSKTFGNFALGSRNIKNIISKSIIFSTKSTKFNDKRNSFSSKLFRLSWKLNRLRRFFSDFTVYFLTFIQNIRLAKS